MDIQVTDLTYAYGKNVVLRNVGFTLRPARVYGLIGENGSGKTTLLSLLAGIQSGRSGKFEGFTQPGLLLQGTGFYRNLSVLDNLHLFALEAGVRATAVESVLDFVGYPLERHASPYRTLSQGYRQRLAIARSFLTDGNLILLDEPFNAVDLPTIRDLKRAIRDYVRATRKTVLLSSHQLHEVNDLADGTLLLRGGTVTSLVSHWRQSSPNVFYLSFGKSDGILRHLTELPGLRVLRNVDNTFQLELSGEGQLQELLTWMDGCGLPWTSIERFPPPKFLLS